MKITKYIVLFFVFMSFFMLQASGFSVNKKIVVIDAGHGGWDPGKIGPNDELEKDINLKIAEYVQIYLEIGGAMAFLTRADDTALADKKNPDLLARATLPSELKADILVSVHQNSFSSQNVKGAQVFYYEASENGKRLADNIQSRIASYLDTQNTKAAKANNNYYMLRKSETPAVIVECGFLSNYEEAQQLSSDEYQQRVAWAIYMGIVDYFE